MNLPIDEFTWMVEETADAVSLERARSDRDVIDIAARRLIRGGV